MGKLEAAKKHSVTRRNIFIVEDQPAFREGLVQILNVEKDLMVCGQSESAEQALPAINRLKPDLVLVDITLPGKSGLKLIRELRASNARLKLLVTLFDARRSAVCRARPAHWRRRLYHEAGGPGRNRPCRS